MARIEESKGREKGGGYERLFGNSALGSLMSKVHAAVIRSGNELEKLIRSRVPQIPDLDVFLGNRDMPDGIFMAAKRDVKKSLVFSGSDPDFVIFVIRGNQKICYVIELKDGDTFDTKKAAGERESMRTFVDAQHISFQIDSYFCCFNQISKDEIFDGFKRKIPKSELMTGQELCNLLELDYEEIRAERKSDQKPNFRYFMRELLKVEEVRRFLGRH